VTVLARGYIFSRPPERIPAEDPRMTRMSTTTVALAIACALSTPLFSQTKPLITPKDYGKWELLGASRLSPKGDWVAVGVSRVSEENELRLRGGAHDTTIVAAYGAAPVFSADDKWVAYAIGVPPKERERLTKEKKPIHNGFEARELATGKTISVNDISAFSFSPDERSRSRMWASRRGPTAGRCWR
jgi:hypothetical protein